MLGLSTVMTPHIIYPVLVKRSAERRYDRGEREASGIVGVATLFIPAHTAAREATMRTTFTTVIM
jgi:hypothetical protein